MQDILWLPFIIASIAVISIPGQDMMLIMTKSISTGTKAGMLTAAGVSTGLIVHTIVVSLGLGSLIMASELLFLTIKIAGALYLFYLGYQLMRSNGVVAIKEAGEKKQSWLYLFLYGAISNISNPKILIFYLAFLPQFVGQGVGSPVMKIFCMGLVFAALTFLMKMPVAIFSGILSGWLKRKTSVLKWFMRTSGGLLIFIGINVLIEKRA
ncbi:LysE family translocator [Serratia quinivorans]|uniref:LysE family translocator n=1 Tax=Serratia quinivorans TaxID=137545 RepID=UPI00217A3400|nr:LysE family translocator [Serratia quinivorans]CAI2135880.1 Homoserine/homoserine lactone efflux protein [Serratia quinivorans]CAI2143233.1 Homoserine/homoserine lactone efflux protein [Serratia quinivorans]